MFFWTIATATCVEKESSSCIIQNSKRGIKIWNWKTIHVWNGTAPLSIYTSYKLSIFEIRSFFYKKKLVFLLIKNKKQRQNYGLICYFCFQIWRFWLEYNFPLILHFISVVLKSNRCYILCLGNSTCWNGFESNRIFSCFEKLNSDFLIGKARFFRKPQKF